MLPIRSREVTCAQRSGVRHREDALQPLDFGKGLVGVHPSQYLTEPRRGRDSTVMRSAGAPDWTDRNLERRK